MTLYLDDREVIYLFHGGVDRITGEHRCGACAEADPELDKFLLKHPGTMAVRLDASGPHAERLGVKITATPTYVFRRGDRGIMHVGLLTAPQIEKWMKGIDKAA
jgi:protein-disulfide isomerase